MPASIDDLDTLLQRSDSDSMEWADGGGAEEAEAMLSALPLQDWANLEHLRQVRNPRWRACLASVLRPQQGEQAGQLLITLASDQDTEVAFLAMRAVAFNCGVNASAQGPFIDPKVRVESFLLRAKTTEGLAAKVLKVRSSCTPSFQRQFELLAAVLKSEA